MINSAVILLSGSGIRFGHLIPKQFIEIKGTPLFSYSLMAFHKNTFIDEIVLVVNPMYIDHVNRYLNDSTRLFTKPVKVIEGGKTRQNSSFLGVSSIKDSESKVLIHDAVRPFINQSIIDECIFKLDKFKAVSTVIPVSDTLYCKDNEDRIIDIPKRENYIRAQTPQGFYIETIIKAHQLAIDDGFDQAPDDCFLIQKYKLAEIGLVAGDVHNFKVTYPVDIAFAETILDKNYEV
jgi:ribitol-5-phosphate 2-dehydrogenase (NADP+) / D-ribitol-5-phosphate cytidylyltransferase